MEIVNTGFKDKYGEDIFVGSILCGESIDSEIAEYTVRWSKSHKKFIGDSRNEIYDISQSIFDQYEVIK